MRLVAKMPSSTKLPRSLPLARVIVDPPLIGDVADEALRGDVAADDLVGGRRDGHAADPDHVRQAVDEDLHVDGHGRDRVGVVVEHLGPLGQPDGVRVGVARERAQVVAAELDDGVDAALDGDHVGGLVVDHAGGDEAPPGADVREDVRQARIGGGDAVEVSGVVVAVEADHGRERILRIGVRTGVDDDDDRDEPVRGVEVDGVVGERQQRVGIDVRPLREPAERIRAGQLDLALRRGVHRDLEAHQHGAGVHLQLHEQLVDPPGVRAVEVEPLDHQRAAILVGRPCSHLGDVDARGVVVAQADLDVADGDGVEVRVLRDRRVLYDDHDVAFGAGVVDGVDVDPLPRVPVARRERQHEGAVVLVHGHAVDDLEPLEGADVLAIAAARRTARAQPDGVALAVAQRAGDLSVDDRLRVRERVVELLLRRASRRHGDVHRGRRDGGQPYGVAVDLRHRRRATFADGGAFVALVVDDHLALVGRGQVVLEPVHRQAVVEHVAVRPLGDDPVVDRAADALELASDDVVDHVAGDVDRVRPEPADHAVGDAERRRQDEELVVALQAVDLDDLDRRVAHVQPCAVDRLGRDGDVVGELGARARRACRTRCRRRRRPVR